MGINNDYKKKRDSEYQDAYLNIETGDKIQTRRDADGKKHFRTVKGEKPGPPKKPGKNEYQDAYSDGRGKVIQSRRDEKGKKHYRTIRLKEQDLHELIKESVKSVLMEMNEPSQDMEAKARELVKKVKDWNVEEITDRIDYYCAEGIIYGEAEDENGEWWSFRAGGMIDDGEVVDVQYDYDIEFTAPDGTTGWI